MSAALPLEILAERALRSWTTARLPPPPETSASRAARPAPRRFRPTRAAEQGRPVSIHLLPATGSIDLIGTRTGSERDLSRPQYRGGRRSCFDKMARNDLDQWREISWFTPKRLRPRGPIRRLFLH